MHKTNNMEVTQEDLSSLSQLGKSKLYSDFSVDLTPQLLMEFIQQYGLKVSDISGHYLVDHEALSTAGEIEHYELEALITTLNLWPKMLNWGQFLSK